MHRKGKNHTHLVFPFALFPFFTNILLSRAILKRVTMDLEDVQGLDRDLLLAEISRAKGKGQTPETYQPRYPFDKTVAAAFSRYQKSLEKSKNLVCCRLLVMFL